MTAPVVSDGGAELEVLGNALYGRAEEDTAAFASEVNRATVTDSGSTELPTVAEADDPLWFGEEDENGQPTGSGVELSKGEEFTGLTVKAGSQPFWRAGVWEGEPAVLVHGPDGSLQRIETAESTVWFAYGADGKRYESLRFEDGLITVLNAAGQTRARIAGDRDNVSAAISVHGNTILDRAMRIDADTNRGYIFGTWTDADGRIVGTNGLTVDLQTGRVTAPNGIGTEVQPAYIKPPKGQQRGPAAAINGIGATMTDVLTVTLVTDYTCDIEVGGHLRVRTNVVTDATNTWAWQVTLDGVVVHPYVDYSANGKQTTGIVSERYLGVAPGTHTLKLQAAASGTSNTIDVIAERAQLFATAILA